MRSRAGIRKTKRTYPDRIALRVVHGVPADDSDWDLETLLMKRIQELDLRKLAEHVKQVMGLLHGDGLSVTLVYKEGRLRISGKE